MRAVPASQDSALMPFAVFHRIGAKPLNQGDFVGLQIATIRSAYAQLLDRSRIGVPHFFTPPLRWNGLQDFTRTSIALVYNLYTCCGTNWTYP